MQHNVIINSIACTVLYVILLFHTIFASQHYFKLNMINQTQVFVEGGQVSDKSNTRDHNTVYSKQIFIICYTAHRTCPRCLFRSVHIRRQLASAGGLLWCVACPRQVTNHSLRPPDPNTLQTHNWQCTTKL